MALFLPLHPDRHDRLIVRRAQAALVRQQRLGHVLDHAAGLPGALRERRFDRFDPEALPARRLRLRHTVGVQDERLTDFELKRVDPDQLTGGRGRLVTVYNDNDGGAP